MNHCTHSSDDVDALLDALTEVSREKERLELYVEHLQAQIDNLRMPPKRYTEVDAGARP